MAGSDTPEAGDGNGRQRHAGTPDTSVAGHRRGGGARPSRLRSVRAQLLAPIIVAMAGLAVLSTAQAATATSAASDAARARTLAATATSAVKFVHELEREVDETSALRQRGGKSGVSLVVAQRERTDAAARQYLADSRDLLTTVPALDTAVRTVNDLYGRLGATRESADNNAAITLMSDPVYRPLAESLLAIADAVPTQIQDNELANAARAVAAVAAVEHFAALERDLLRDIFSRGAVKPGDLGAMSELRGARDQRVAEFQRAATSAERSVYDDEIRGIDVDRADRLSSAARNADKEPAGLKVDADAWFVAQSGFIRRLDLVGLNLSDSLDAHAEEIASTAQRRALATVVGTVVVGLAALATAIALAVRTGRRLRRLRAAALTVARHELPEVIHSVTVGGTVPTNSPAAAATRSIAATNDEIGQVADAFATVHRTALKLASEQAELRIDVSRMAEVLARRIRTLITRQLRLLDEFERDETDPDMLARLFALDHLAARLRRNGENLLVLAGGEPGRPATQAVPIAAVITAAASEIEDFQRIDAQPADIAITGPVVGDLVHLLAELLENATAFSPPTQQVRVDARATVDGAMIRVHDNGIGITRARLVEINSRLATPSALSSAAAGTMGLHVVSHLAARHRIRVELHATGSGTVAYVALPHRALERVSALPPGPTATAAAAGRTAALPAYAGSAHSGSPAGFAATGHGPSTEGSATRAHSSAEAADGLAAGAGPRAGVASSAQTTSAGYTGRLQEPGLPAQSGPAADPGSAAHAGSSAFPPWPARSNAAADPAATTPSAQATPAQATPARATSAHATPNHTAPGHPVPAAPTKNAAVYAAELAGDGVPADRLVVPSIVGPPIVQPTGNLTKRPSEVYDDGPTERLVRRPARPPVGPEVSREAAWFRPDVSAPPAPGAWPPRAAHPTPMAAGAEPTDSDLPRRRPGAQLAPGVAGPRVQATRRDAVDPEAVRSRLSAFAEGVSAAARRTNTAAPGQKDQ